MLHRIPFVLLFLCCCMLLTACSEKKTSSVTYPIDNMEFVFEGPLFEGSNEAQVKVSFDPSAVLEKAGFNKKNIQDIRLQEITLTRDSSNFDLFESMTVQFAGGESGMTTVALLSEVPKQASSVSPAASEAASCKGLKDATSFYVVIDANLNKDWEENLLVKGTMTLSIDVKP